MPIRPVLLWFLTLAACDETASSVSRDYVDRHREAFEFHADRAKVVDGIRGILADRGLTLVEPTTGDTLHSTAGEPSLGSTTEYTIHLIPARDGMLVHLVRQFRDQQGSGAIYSAARATDLEWELAQRVEPDRALAITQQANTRADKVSPRARVAP